MTKVEVVVLVLVSVCGVQALQFDGAFTPDLLRGVVGFCDNNAPKCTSEQLGSNFSWREGFNSTYILNGQHKFGGHFRDEFSTYLDCITGCREDTYCLAVDFSQDQSACWFHDYTTACSAPGKEPGVKHIQLSNCISGVSVAGGDLVSRHVTERDCVSSCKLLLNCYGVDYNVKTHRCYHHYMGTICTTKKADPDTVHYTRVNCKSSPNAVRVSVGHFVFGGTVSAKAFSEGACTTACVHDRECQGVDYYYSNHTCMMHTSNTACDPRLPQDGVSHFQFKECTPEASTVERTFRGQVTYPDGSPIGMRMTLADGVFSCIDLCHMTDDCTAVDWSLTNGTCYFLSSNVGCNSVSDVPDVEHHELTDCKMSGDVHAYHQGFHVLGGTLKAEYRTRDRCVDKCMQPGCQGVDWDEVDGACYHHTDRTTCHVLVTKSGCSHYKFKDCKESPRKVLELTNSTLLPGQLASYMAPDAATCIEMCGAISDCFAADYHIEDMECILHGLDDSCRPAVPVEGYFSYIFANCNDVIPGAVNITNSHVPGATFVQMANNAEECYRQCKLADSCAAADFDSNTLECYRHDDKTACEPVIPKAGCTHFRLTDCLPKVVFTMQNAMVPDGVLAKSVANELQCFKLCRDHHYCVAFDYNTPLKECRLHDLKTGCDVIEDSISWAHHKLQQCHDLPQSVVTKTVYGQAVLGGTLVGVLGAPVACIDKCFISQISGSQPCLAVNYDFSTQECWFLYGDDACSQLVPTVNVSYYRLYDCESNTIPFGNKLYDYPGHRRMVEDGSPNAQSLSKQECIGACQAHGSCEGVDYNEGEGTCQFHYSATACGVLMPDPAFAHYSFNDCKGGIVIAKDVKTNYILQGGTPQTFGSPLACVTACTGSCFAVSYNKFSGACMLYTIAEACQTPVSSQGSVLYILTDCASDVTSHLVTATYSASKWGGGTAVTEAKTKAECLKACSENAICTAFSYNYRKTLCYVHETTRCAPVLKGKESHDYSLYITSRAQCEPGNIFIVHSYGKFHQAGAMLVGQYPQDQCLQMCHDTALCLSVDYNPANLACWFHGSSSCHNKLIRDARISHFKVKDCSAPDGT